MNTIFTKLRVPAILSLLINFPFILLEMYNGTNSPESFPFVLFGTLWLIMFMLILISMPLFRILNSNKANLKPFNLFSRIALAVLMAFFWIGIIADQMPCFLGIPNCD